MSFKIHILLLLISTFICSPPPIPQPPYEISIEEPILEEARQSSSNIKNLEENTTPSPKQFVESTKVVVNILENGLLEDHALNVTTKNLGENQFYKAYTFSLSLSQQKSLEVKSNSCYKFKLSGEKTDNEECTISPLQITDNTYKFSYNYSLYKEEYIVINYKILITSKNPEILYRQESISVPKMYFGGFCDYKFILSDNYANLGLEDYNFTKESDKIYSYNGSCPSEQITDVVRMAPKESYWKADYGIYLETEEPNPNNITFLFPRVYRGGKNRNKNYKITSYENKVLKESDLIKDEIFLEASVPGKNNKKVGIDLHTAFSNKLDDEFLVYPSESFYDIDTNNIDNTIKAKAEEIINDPNSKYKDKPNYYKIGKFVHSHITYNLSFHGQELTPLDIYNGKKGVCEHYTILYNAMLNAIGIKAFKTFGWALDKEQTSANQQTIGHAWTVALVDGKFKELDATWDLFEGVPAGHILKGYNKETYSYSYTGTTVITRKAFNKIENLVLVNNLDDEDEDSESPTTSSESGESPTTSSKSKESGTALRVCLMEALLLLLYLQF